MDKYLVKVEHESVITLPDEIVQSMGIKAGDNVHIREFADGRIELTFPKTEEVQIDLPEHVLLQLMTMAHEQDITLNQLVNKLLREWMDKEMHKERRISINNLQKKKKFDKMIKSVDNGQTIIICEDDECEKPIMVMVPIDRYNEMKNFLPV